MNKNLTIFLLSFTLLICLLTILFNSQVRKALNKSIIDLRSDLNDCEYNSKRNKEKYIQCLFSENKNISDVYLVGSTYDSILLSRVINSTKLIYRFYESSCVQCVEEELNLTKQLADSIGANNIIILSDYNNINMLSAIINRKNITSSYFVFNKKFELPIEYDENAMPSYFLLDANLRTKFVFKTGGHQNIVDPYYKRIIWFFKNGN